MLRGVGRDEEVHREARRLVDAYGGLALRLAYTYLGSRQDAEDVSQDVLCKMITRSVPFNGPEHERAWVIRCTANACKDLLRSAARTRNVPLDAVTELPDAAATLDDADDAPGQVTQAVMRLPPLYREAVYLHYYEDMSIKEIAEAVDAAPSAVAKRLSRAREELRERLEGHDDGRDDARDDGAVSGRDGDGRALRRATGADGERRRVGGGGVARPC